MDQRDRFVAFAQKWGIPEDALEAFISECGPDSVVTDGGDASETYLGLDEASVMHSDSEGMTLSSGVFEPIDTDPTIQYIPHSLTPGVSISDEALPTEETEREMGPLGRYQDLGLLGMGGMGEVRRVRDPSLRRSMAMKIIHWDMMDSSRLVSRFIEEAQVEAQLQHPNIVPVYEIGRLPDGRHYFTMKQIRGKAFTDKIAKVHEASLDDRWRAAEDGTTFRDLIRIHQQVCETVAYAHSQGVIHRDLKPDNIMIGGFAEVLVVDWGLAKVLGRREVESDERTEEIVETDRSRSSAMQTHMGSVAGTPCYMAPEQAFGRNEQVGKGTDVYTLGAILYEILSGVPPYRGESAKEVLEKVKNSRPSVLKELDSKATTYESITGEPGAFASVQTSPPLSSGVKIPERLARICESAMQREIGDRTASAQDLAAELRSWLEGAEKREKGLAEVEKARLLAEQAQGQERKSAAEWREANALLERDGADSKQGWALWSSSQESETESRKLWRRYVRQLQGALVHAPDLEEAHEALARQRLDELIAAAAVGDRSGRETREQQLNAHLAMLPSILRTELESKRDRGLSDVIAGQRYRRGVLVGRHVQREAVASQVDGGARVLTLLGTAGVGKTRLALELAEDLRSGFSRTVFCDLTEATDGLGIARRLSRAMQVRLRDTDPIGHLTEVLAAEPILLVLDNLEQVVEVIGPMIDGWSTHCEGLQLLCTSRVRLGIGSEVVVPIQPLSLLEGVDLFVRRGQAADPGFELSTSERPALCALVRKLDSLPLALELAAARLNILSLDELSVRLNERFSLLRSRGRNAKALDGALDWSWGLLQPWAKAALSQASLFRGGFTLAAAEGVIDVGRHPKTPAMFDILGELVDNSLLRKDQIDSGRVRYSLLESIRVYADFKLGHSGEMGPELRGREAMGRAQQRHAAHYSHLGTPQALRALDGFDSAERWDALFSELDNLVQSISYGTSKSAPLCCLAALKVLGMKGPVSLGVDISTQVLTMKGLGRRVRMLLEIERSKCLRISGRMAEARAMVGTSSMPPKEMDSGSPQAGDPPSLEDAETIVDSLFSLKNSLAPNASEAETVHLDDEELVEAERLLLSGIQARREGKLEQALDDLQAAREYFYSHGDGDGEGRALSEMGRLHSEQDRSELAIRCLEESVRLHEESGNRRLLGVAQGTLARMVSDVEQSVDLFERAIGLAGEVGDQRSQVLWHTQLGSVLFDQNELEDAEQSLRKAIILGHELGEESVVEARVVLAKVLVENGQNQEAHALIQMVRSQLRGDSDDALVVEELLSRLGKSPVSEEPVSAPLEAERLMELGHIEQGQSNFESARDSFQQALKLYQDHSDRLGEGTALGAIGLIHATQGNFEQSLECLTQALTISREVGSQQSQSANLRQLSNVYQVLGDSTRAVQFSNEALALAQSIGDTRSEVRSLAQVGRLAGLQGQHDTAIEHYLAAIQMARDVGDLQIEAVLMGNIGSVYQSQGQFPLAVEHLTHAIRISHQIGNKSQEAISLGNLGLLYSTLGEYESAAKYLSQSVSTARDNELKPLLAVHLGNLGIAQQGLGQKSRAIETFGESIAVCRKIGDRRSECVAIANLSELYAQLDRCEEAESGFRDAIVMGDEEFPLVGGAARASLAHLLAKSGRMSEALAFLDDGARHVEPYPEEHVKFLCKQGHVQCLAGDVASARTALEKARKIVGELKVNEHSELAQSVAELDAMLAGMAVDESCPTVSEASQSDVREYSEEERDLALIEAQRLMELGRIERAQSHYELAVPNYDGALQLFRRFGDRNGEAKALGNLASVNRACGQHDLAVQHYVEAISIARDIGNQRSEGRHLGNLGVVYQSRGQLAEAIDYYTQSIDIAQAIGEKRTEGIHRGNLGIVYQMLGQFDRATEQIRLALDLAREVGNRRSEGINLGNLGDALFKQHRMSEAEEAYRQAIELCDETVPGAAGACRGSLALLLAQNNELDEAYALLEMGESQVSSQPQEYAKFICEKGQVLLLSGEVVDAQNALKQAQEIADSLQVREGSELGRAIHTLRLHLSVNGDSSRRPTVVSSTNLREKALVEAGRQLELGRIEVVESQYSAARMCFEKSLKLFREHEHRAGESKALGNLASVYQFRGEYAQAIAYNSEALCIAQEIGDERSAGIHLGNLGKAHQVLGDMETAREHYRTALDIARQTGDQLSECFNLGNLGIVCQIQGQFEEAISHFEHALELARAVGNRGNEGIILGNLGDVSAELERYDIAADYLRQAISMGDDSGQTAAGAFRGSLALIVAQQGDALEAQQLIAVGEKQVAAFPEEYAKFLCKKGRVCLLLNDVLGAESACQRAEAIATDLKVASDSQLSRAVADLEKQLLTLKIQSSMEVLGEVDEPTSERDLALIEAERILELGNIEYNESNFPQALQWLEQALDQFRTLEERVRQAHAMMLLGRIHMELDDLGQAARLFESAHQIYQEEGHRRGEAEVLGLIGISHHRQHAYESAIDYLSRSIRIQKDVGDIRLSAINLRVLGLAYKKTGQPQLAIDVFKHALEIHRKVGDRKAEGSTLGMLALAHSWLGEVETAIDLLMEALVIHREVGARRPESICLGNLANCYQTLGRYPLAIEHYEQAIQINGELGAKGPQGIMLGNLGDAFLHLGRLDDALPVLLRAIEQCREAVPDAAGAFYGTLALLHARQDNLDAAVVALQNGEPLVESAPEEHAKFLCKKGHVWLLAQDEDAAVEALTHAKRLADTLNVAWDTNLGRAIQSLSKSLADSSVQGAATVLFDEMSDEERELVLLDAERWMELGNLEREQGQSNDAEQCFRKALSIFRTHQHQEGEGRALGNLGLVLFHRGELQGVEDLFRQAIQILKSCGDRSHYNQHLGNLASFYRSLGQFDLAIETFNQAIRAAQELNDRLNEGQFLGNLGNVFLAQGDYDAAIEHYRQAIDLAVKNANRRSEGVHIGNLGLAYFGRSEFERAIEQFTLAIDIERELGTPREEGINLGNMAEALTKLERFDEAIDYFQQAIALCEQTQPVAAGAFRGALAWLKVRRGEVEAAEVLLVAGEAEVRSMPEEYAKFLCKKGHVRHFLGDVEGARSALIRAQEVSAPLKFSSHSEVSRELTALVKTLSKTMVPTRSADFTEEQVALQLTEAERLFELGSLEEEHADYNDAMSCFEQALEIFRTHQNRRGEARTLIRLTSLYLEFGKIDQSIQSASQSIHIYRELGDRKEEGAAIGALGGVHWRAGSIEFAKQCIQQAVTILREEKDIGREGHNLNQLGLLYSQNGQKELAIECFERAIALHQKAGNRRQEGSSLGAFARTCGELGHYDRAIELLRQAIEIHRETGVRRSESMCLGNLGNFHLAQGDNEAAREHYSASLRIAREIGFRRTESNQLGNLGIIHLAAGEHLRALECFQQAASIAREIQYRRNEGLCLGNLGCVLMKLDRWDEAHEAFRESIAISDEIMPPVAGLFRGFFARVLAQQENFEQAFVHLEIGEEQVKVNPGEHGVFLCEKGTVLLWSGNMESAQMALHQAKDLMETLQVSKESELGLAVAALSALLRSAPKP